MGERWWWRSSPVDPNRTPLIVYASPSCSCCTGWIRHLEDNGFAVTRETAGDVTRFKKKYGVPEQLWSCHTARVEGYTIEGHVPADEIQRLLREKPLISGLAVAGMPNGSPGMEASIKDRYEVIAFTGTKTEVYAVR